MNHRSLRSDADTIDLCSEVWKVLADGTSSLSCSGSFLWTAEINQIEMWLGQPQCPVGLARCCSVRIGAHLVVTLLVLR